MNQLLFLYLILTSFVTLSIGAFAFMKQHKSTTLPFATLMIATTFHSFGYAFEHIVLDTDLMVYLLKFEYIGISFFPVLIVWFSISMKSEVKGSDVLILIIFFATSLTTFFLVQTNDFHHMYYNEIMVMVRDSRLYLGLTKGVWFYVQGFMLTSASFIMLLNTIKTYKNSTGKYKAKAKNILTFMYLPLILGVVMTLKILPPTVDFFPLTYGGIGLIWLIDFQKQGIFQLMPVTYKKVFEEISEGVIVLDKNNIIVNYNLAAYDVFKEQVKLLNGMDIKPVLNNLDFIESEEYAGKVFEIKYKNRIKACQLKNTDMYDHKQTYQGKIIVINDISKELQAGKILKLLATTDSLTGMNNRRHFFDVCRTKIQQACIENKSISFVLMDIDHFKLVNDNHGHMVGDNVLKEVSSICNETLRPCDLMGRYGGEEFAIMLYDTSLYDTHQIIERMRSKISTFRFSNEDDVAINITVSFGIHRPNLLVEDDMNMILRKADKSLYQAKNEGRDRIVFYSDHIA